MPSAVLLVTGVWAWFATDPHLLPDVRYANVQSTGLVGLLNLGAYLLAKAFKSLGSASRFLAQILVAVGAFVATLSTAVFLTGRGFWRHATWARISGFVIAVILLAAAAVVPPRLSWVVVAGSIYILWVLGWRYS